MANIKRVTRPRVSKQFWRDFGTFVRTSRKYADVDLPAAEIVEELNALVSYHDLESLVTLGGVDAEQDSAQTVMFDGKAEAAS